MRARKYVLDTVPDFLYMMGIKPHINPRRPTFINDFLKSLHFLKMCPIFAGSVFDFGRSDNDMKRLRFQKMHMWFHAQLTQNNLERSLIFLMKAAIFVFY